MRDPDVIFLHAPSLYDFRKKAVLHGPISDVIPSGPVFEMYPIGFLSLCGHLEKEGFSTRIINIANKMLNSLKYDPEEEIRALRPRAFAIDLHWLPHVQGSLKIGEIAKKYHPDIPVIYGGYSATYFHEELIRYPFVDYVLRGDSTELPVVMLIKAIRENGDIGGIPNLTYKSKDGHVRSNGIAYVPGLIDHVLTEYEFVIDKTFKFFDLYGYMPFQTWMNYPITAVFLYRGCLYNCKTCGGSRRACEQVFNRQGLAFKTPEKVVAELKAIERYFNTPVMLVGDIQQNGKAYAHQLLDEIKRANLRNEIALEFFAPPTEETVANIEEAIPKYNVEMSPESHDEQIRRAFGRPFNNAQLERAVEACLRHNARRIDLFFMIGLSGQTYQSVMQTIDYCDYLLKTFGHKKNLHPFVSPLAPFVDPGSEVWEHPEQYGYRFFARTLDEHRRLMESALSWKYFLDYETRWMTREEIVSATYEAALRLNELKRKYGLISPRVADLVEHRAKTAVRYMKRIDETIERGGENSEDWKKIAAEIRDMNIHTICYKGELNWPLSAYRFNVFKILALILKTRLGALFAARKLKNRDH